MHRSCWSLVMIRDSVWGLGLCKIIILRACECSEVGCYGNQPKKCKRSLQNLKVLRYLEITWSGSIRSRIFTYHSPKIVYWDGIGNRTLSLSVIIFTVTYCSSFHRSNQNYRILLVTKRGMVTNSEIHPGLAWVWPLSFWMDYPFFNL